VACLNGGDRARLFGLFSEDGLRWVLGPCDESGALVTPAALLVTGATSPGPPQLWPPFVIRDVRQPPDGRVAAIVAADWQVPENPISAVWVMSQQGGSWRIDLIIGSSIDLTMA
jgi:hypothetical protein